MSINITGDNGRQLLVFCDTEYTPQPGENPTQICAHFYERNSDQHIALWDDELSQGFPYPTDAKILFVSFSAVAELIIFEGLGYRTDFDIIDLWAEAKNIMNIAPTQGVAPQTYYLNSVLHYFGLPTLTENEHKKKMHDRCKQGAPFDDDERIAIQAYCRDDVLVLPPLFDAVMAHINTGDGR